MIGRQPTGGYNPIHLAFDATGKFLFVTNYGTDSIAVLPGEAGRHARPLPDPRRRSRARSGRIAPSRRTCGRTTIRSIARAASSTCRPRAPTASSPIASTPSAASPSTPTKWRPAPAPAPRHIDFHPRKALAYVINELDSTITTYRQDRASGQLTPLQVVPLDPSRTSPATAPAPRSRSIAPAATSTSPTAATTASACSGSIRPRARWRRGNGCRPRAACRASSPSIRSERFLYVANQGGHIDRRLPRRARRQALTEPRSR